MTNMTLRGAGPCNRESGGEMLIDPTGSGFESRLNRVGRQQEQKERQRKPQPPRSLNLYQRQL